MNVACSEALLSRSDEKLVVQQAIASRILVKQVILDLIYDIWEYPKWKCAVIKDLIYHQCFLEQRMKRHVCRFGCQRQGNVRIGDSLCFYKQSGPNWLNLSGFLSWMLIPVYDSLSFSNALWNDWSQWGARGLRRSPRGVYDQWYGSVMLEQSRLTDYANKITCEATIVTVPNRV